MSKPTTKKTSPNKLTKTGKKAGVQLTEAQLDQASGGYLKAPTFIKY